MRTAALSAFAYLCAMMICVSGASAGSRDLLAHGGDSHIWLGSVSTVKETESYDKTDLRYRAGFGESWQTMPPVSSRIVSMASSNGELVAVLADQSWWILSDSENYRQGPPLPNARIIAVGNESDVLWAVGIVGGAMPATASSTLPAGDVAAGLSTQPSTMGATMATAMATTTPSTSPSGAPLARRLMAYRFDSGKWINPVALPEGAPEDPTHISMTVVDQQPVIAWLDGDGNIRVIRLGGDGHWSATVVVHPPAGLDDFKLLSIQGKPTLWVVPVPRNVDGSPAGPFTAGFLYRGDDLGQKVALGFQGVTPTPGSRQTLALAFGRLRLLAMSDGKLYEQTYELDGQTVASAAPVPDAKPLGIPIGPWVAGAVFIVLVATVSALMQRRNGAADIPAPRDGRLQLAPLGVRLAAGVVDMLPFLAGAYVVQPIMAVEPNAWRTNPSVIHLMDLATTTYILHTFLAEIICGQSLGKMIFNLRVVGPDGKLPKTRAIIVRNILRLLDVGLVFPLLLVIFSPLRQRVGDMAAGTVVVSKEPESDTAQPSVEE